MKIIMVWGQRTCSYPGEYAPELLEAIDENGDDENPDVINNCYKEYSQEGSDFEQVRIAEIEIKDSDIESLFKRQSLKSGRLIEI